MDDDSMEEQFAHATPHPIASVEKRLQLLEEICKPIIELDWCIGYELPDSGHMMLEDVRNKLYDYFTQFDPKSLP